jgi:hypothetical protein
MIFYANRITWTEFVEILRSRSLVVGDISVGLPELSTTGQWQRRQSNERSVLQTLPWPSIEMRLASSSGHSEPQDHLVSDAEAPSFMSAFIAANSFFRLHRQLIAGGNIGNDLIYRHQDTRGRIRQVQVGNDVIRVTVEGSSLDGLTLELAGNEPGQHRSLTCPDSNTAIEEVFQCPDGPPGGAWVLLRQGAEWLDRRFLSLPWASSADADVEFIVESGTRLEVLVASGERDQVEFKRQIPKDEDSKGKLMKTICAFANQSGGSVLIGVDDEATIVGVPTPGLLT